MYGVAYCWGWSELVKVAAGLPYEGGCLDFRGGWYKEFTGDTKGLAVDELWLG